MSQTRVTSYFSKGKKRANDKIVLVNAQKPGFHRLNSKTFNLPEIRSPTYTVTKKEKSVAHRKPQESLVSNDVQTAEPLDVVKATSISDVVKAASIIDSSVLLSTTPVTANKTPSTPKRVLSDPHDVNISSKKRKCSSLANTSSAKEAHTPTKDDTIENHSSVRKRLVMTVDSPKKDLGPFEDPKKPANKAGGLVSLVKEAGRAATSVPPPLAQETAMMPLPPSYKFLLEVFHCTDTVVSMLYNRKEACTFEKLKGGVQNMTKRQFTLSQLGQIKTVCPSLFLFTVEKTPASAIRRDPKIPHHQLVITPNLKDYRQEIKGMSPVKAMLNSSPVKGILSSSPVKGILSSSPVKGILNSSPVKSALSSSPMKAMQSSSPVKPKSPSFNPMTPICLVERKRLFTFCLLNIAKRHHQDFLSLLNPPVKVPVDKLKRWHPKFDLLKVPDIEVASLPELPNEQKICSAKDVLNKIAEKQYETVKKALEFVASKSSGQEKVQPDATAKKNTKNNKWLKGIDAGLLQRIRERESARNMETMIASPEEKKREKMLQRVPELVRILRAHFLIERKAAVKLEEAVKKLVDSCRGFLDPVEAEEHIKFMAKIFPKWLVLIEIRKQQFLKIDKNMDINVLLQNIPKS